MPSRGWCRYGQRHRHHHRQVPGQSRTTARLASTPAARSSAATSCPCPSWMPPSTTPTPSRSPATRPGCKTSMVRCSASSRVKPGGLYVSYEWVTKSLYLYRAKAPEHVECIHGIECGNALPGLRHQDEIVSITKKMLSIRNGLYLPSANLSGVPEALAPSEVCATLNQSGVKASDSGVALLPAHQISVAHYSFDPPNHDQRHNQPLVLQSVPTSSTTIEPRFLQEPAQANLQSFQLALPPEMVFKEDMMLKHRPTSVQETTSLPGHEVKPARQETCMVNSGCFDRGSPRKEVAQDMMLKNTESVLFMPYLHRFYATSEKSIDALKNSRELTFQLVVLMLVLLDYYEGPTFSYTASVASLLPL